MVAATVVGLDDPFAAVEPAKDEPIGASGGIRRQGGGDNVAASQDAILINALRFYGKHYRQWLICSIMFGKANVEIAVVGVEYPTDAVECERGPFVIVCIVDKYHTIV